MPKCLRGLGFQDLHLFNQALLAIQSWQLIQLPYNIYARLLKTMYYLRGELVDIVFPSEASPMWRSIEHDLDLLKKCII
jgi:hypothetical protein